MPDQMVSKRSDLLTARQIEEQVRLDVLTAISQTEAAKDSVRLAKIARDFCQKYLDAEQKKYELGTSQIFFVLAGADRAGQCRLGGRAERDHLPAKYPDAAAQDRRITRRTGHRATVVPQTSFSLCCQSMGRIRILSDLVANKIAAGEVVERPASVVKELLENSLDAGATDFRVEIENGGRRLIRIADDGCGMLRDDALLAFERHATSKLHDVKDLLSIATLGFRGEALPSIASVSRLLLETRSLDEQTGTRVEIAGGKILSCDEIARGGGTTITVRDLFFNVPARKKFLRSEQTELAHIASLVTHYSLAHPDKTFELWHNGARTAACHARRHAARARVSGFGSQCWKI